MTGIDARFQLDWPGFALEVDLALPGRGVTALFGHSGSGKTTLLRCIAGLERARSGFLSVAGEVWQDTNRWVPTHKRPIGYVFQESSLFPHLTVMGNLRYGMKRNNDAQQVSLDQAIELLGIGHLLDRKPGRLSGGERQRVGIARALAISPRLLLMDEPLAALDLKRKQEVLPYLERLHNELEIPVLYVSHQPDEVVRLADHVVLLESGRVLAQGPLLDMLTRPDSPLAHGDAAGSVIEATVSAHDEAFHLTTLASRAGQLSIPREDLPPGTRLRLRIPARDVSLTLAPQSGTSILNILPARVEEIVAERPGQVMVRLNAGGDTLLARITAKSAAQLGIVAGRDVFVQVKGMALLD